jgi:hypothetical protein
MRVNDLGIAREIGLYGDALEYSSKNLMLFGTHGIRSVGSVSEQVEAQAEQAWPNVCAALDRANTTRLNLLRMC